MMVCLLLLASLLAGASGATLRAEDSHFVHRYLLKQYQRTTDLRGNIRPEAHPEDLATWGFLDDFSG